MNNRDMSVTEIKRIILQYLTTHYYLSSSSFSHMLRFFKMWNHTTDTKYTETSFSKETEKVR